MNFEYLKILIILSYLLIFKKLLILSKLLKNSSKPISINILKSYNNL